MRFAAAERLSAILNWEGAGALTWINLSRMENNYFGFCAVQQPGTSHTSQRRWTIIIKIEQLSSGILDTSPGGNCHTFYTVDLLSHSLSLRRTSMGSKVSGFIVWVLVRRERTRTESRLSVGSPPPWAGCWLHLLRLNTRPRPQTPAKRRHHKNE